MDPEKEGISVAINREAMNEKEAYLKPETKKYDPLKIVRETSGAGEECSLYYTSLYYTSLYYVSLYYYY